MFLTICPNPVIEERYSEQATLIHVEKYNEIIKEICNNHNIAFFSRYSSWKKRELKDLYKDATHPNAKGHQIMADEIYDYLTAQNFI